jgi:uncharacterized protein YndB with AHSA1/START domain
MDARTDPICDDELFITRVFKAPVSLVFRIWEDPQHLVRWWGPKGFTCTSFELDFRPGGKWRACIESKRHGPGYSSGEFREIEKEKRIVFTFSWEGGDAGRSGVGTLVTVTFKEMDGNTIQTFHQTPFPNIEGRDSHVIGWSQLLDKEQTYAENLARGE